MRGSVTLCVADVVTVLEGPLAPFYTNHNALSSFSFVALNSVRSDSIAFWLEFKARNFLCLLIDSATWNSIT